MARQLTSEERTFFALVSQAAFANPFGKERESLDLQISGASPGASREAVLEAVVTRVWARLTPLAPIDLNAYDRQDREVLELAVLFSAFHKFSPRIDAHIHRQIRAGAKPVVADWAPEVLADLMGQGFAADSAKRFLEIFFQMRRAYHFVAESLVGEAASMQRLRAQLWNNVFTHDIRLYEGFLWNRMEDFSTFFIGETGTGKGTAAAAVGRSGYIPYDESSRRFEHSFTESFVPVNLSQFSESLIESELFGHKKGAFTGAVEAHHGVFQRCMRHGTIFLDEVGEASVPVQIKLLRVLQERLFSPVGSHELLRFEGRVIAATNRGVDALREEGRFRDDFYYRMSSDIIEVPTLRERISENPAELDLLVDRIVEKTVGTSTTPLAGWVREAIARDLPEDYAWPGNVRELEQCVRRVAISKEYRGEAHRAHAEDAQALSTLIEEGQVPARELLGRYCSILYRKLGTYEEVGRVTELDRRTVKKYIDGITTDA